MDDYLRRYNNWNIAFFLLFFIFSSKIQIWKTGPDIETKAPLFGYKRRRLYPRGAYIQNYRVQGKKINLGPFILKVMRRSVCISCMAQTRRDESFKTWLSMREIFCSKTSLCCNGSPLWQYVRAQRENIIRNGFCSQKNHVKKMFSTIVQDGLGIKIQGLWERYI